MNIAFVGAGNIAQFHFDAFKGAGANVSSVCTRGESGVEFAKKNGINYYNNLAELIDKENPDGVALLTQPSAYKVLLPLLKEKNIPVMLEKPVSYSLQEGKDLIPQLPEKVMVGQNRRFYSNVTQAKELIEEQDSVTAHFFICERAKDFKNRPEFDRNHWHTLNGIHGIDLMKFLFGSPKNVIHSDHWGKMETSSLSTFNSMVYESEKGHLVHLHSNFDSPGGWRVNVFFEQTEITFFPIEQTQVKNYSGVKGLELRKEDTEYKQGFFRQAQCFLEGISGELPADWVQYDDALDSVALTEQIYGTL